MHFTEAQVTQLIALASAVVAAVSAIFAAKTKTSIAVLHEMVNSRMTELLELTKKEQFALGEKSGEEKKTK